MIARYALPAALVAALGLSGALTWALMTKAALQRENDRLSASLATCGARLSNILEDEASDREIDNLSDDDLRTVPDGWLLPTP